MKLFYYPGACSLAVHIALEWMGADYSTVRMTPASIKEPWYLAMNPGGNVPLLVDGDFVLTENLAILAYVAELHPEVLLLGNGGLRERAEVMRWIAFLNSDVHMAFKPLFSPTRFAPDPSLAGALAYSARLEVRRHLEQLELQLDGRDWLTGARSVADPYLFVILRWALSRKVEVQGLQNLARFAARMGVDPDVQTAVFAEEGRAADLSPYLAIERVSR